MDKIKEGQKVREWASCYPEVTRWLAHIQDKDQASCNFYDFCEWTKKTPTELLNLKEKDSQISPPPNTVEKLLDDFCSDSNKEFSNSRKYNISINVKSFFKWNYRDLAKASGIVSLVKVKPYNALSKEGLRKLWNRALNPRDRALIPFVTCTGIAKETLSVLTWGHLEENWETKDVPCIKIEPELLKGHGRGRYKGVQQITFLTPEAKRELVNYKEWIEEKLERKLTQEEHIWLQTYTPYNPLSYEMLGNLVTLLSDRTKVSFTLHDGRRWINTALEQIGISQNWARKIRGRKVRGEEAPYSQPAIEQLRAKFREAVSLLEFTSETPTIPKEVQDKLAALEAEQVRIKREYGIVRQKGKLDKKPKKDCEDGHCQQIVSEENLGDYLSEGWKVVATLPSGKIVVDR
jgi:hypothetical protein